MLKVKWQYLELFVTEYPEYQKLYESMRLADEHADSRRASDIAGKLRKVMQSKGRL